MNYLIGQLETRGYLERRAEESGDRPLVYLTRRGWLGFETIWKAQLQLESEWADLLGKKRFDDFMRSLRTVSGVGQKGGTKAAQRSRERRVTAAPAK
jgi:hypothetical protein